MPGKVVRGRFLTDGRDDGISCIISFVPYVSLPERS